MAEDLNFEFYDAGFLLFFVFSNISDDFHSTHNKQKMESGQPLNDEDRKPWLKSMSDAASSNVCSFLIIIDRKLVTTE